MSTDFRLERMSRLRAEADRSIRSFLRRATSVPSVSGASRASGGRPPITEGVASDGNPTLAEAAPGAVVVHVKLMGDTIFLDDERRVRALAKEIRRLITEDRRRGLAV